MRVALLWIAVSPWLGCAQAEQVVEDTLIAQLQRVLSRQLDGHVRITRAEFDQRSSHIVATGLEFESERGGIRGNAEELRIALSPSHLDRLGDATIELLRGELWIRSTSRGGAVTLQDVAPPSKSMLRDMRVHWSTPTGSMDATVLSAVVARGDGQPLTVMATMEAVSWAAGRVDSTHKLQPQVLASAVKVTASSSEARPLHLQADITGLSVPRSASHPLTFQEGRGRLVLTSAGGDADVAAGLRGQVEVELAYLSLYAASEGQPVAEVPPLLLADRLELRGGFSWSAGRLEFAEGSSLHMPAPVHLGSLSLANARAGLSGWVRSDGSADLRLSRLQSSAPALEVVGGQLELAFSAQGDTPSPRVQGELRVARVSLSALIPGMSRYGLHSARPADSAAGLITVAPMSRQAASGAALPLRVHTELQLPAMHFASLPFEQGTLRLRHVAHRADRWTSRVERVELRRGRGALVLRGRGSRGAVVELRSIPLSGHLGMRGVTLSGEGTIGERNDVRLRLERAQADGTPLQAELWLGQGAPPAWAGCPVAAPQPDRLRLCGGALSGQLMLDLWLSGGTFARPELAGSLRLRGFDLLYWLGCEEELKRAITLNGALELEPRSRLNPTTWNGQLNLEATISGSGGGSTWGVSSATWPMRKGRVEVDTLRARGPLGSADLSGFFDVARGHYELRGRGSLDAAQFAKRYTDLNSARGVIDLDFDLNDEQGARLRFSPQGISAHVGNLGLPDLYLREVSGTMRWDGEDFRFEDLRARVGGGEIRLSGRSEALGTFAPMDLEIEAEDVSLEPFRGMRLSLSAQATLSAQAGNGVPTLAGTVQVHQLHYNRRLALQQLLQLDEERPRDAAPRMAFDLLLQDRGRWHVRNSVLDMELTSPNGIQVSGTDRAPGLSGELVAEHGRVRVQGDELQLEQGRIRFTDPERIAPAFEMRASAAATRRPDGRIHLDIAGDGERAEVTLRCQASGPVPQAFRCDYRDDELTCADLDQLARLWACEPHSP